MAQLDARTALATPLESRPFKEVSKGYTSFRDGDLLAAKITPCWENGKVGQAALSHSAGVGSTEFHVVRPSERVHPRYLLHFLRQPSVRASGELRMTGSGGQRRVPASFLGDLKVPLPNLEEQRRIAAILDQADAIRAKRRQVLVHLDSLTQSIFHRMFADRSEPSRPLRELVKWRSGQFLPRRQQREGPHAVYGGNGLTGTHDKFLFAEPRLVVGRVGAYCGAVHVTEPSSWVTDNALVATVRLEGLTLTYLRLVLKAANLNRYASVSGQPSISATRIAEVRIPIASVAAQQELEERLSQVDDQIRLTRIALAADDELFASLHARAFAGEL